MTEINKEKEIERLLERNNYAARNYGHLPTSKLNLEDYIYKTINDSIMIDYHQGVCDGYRNLALHYIISDSSIDAYELLHKVERLIQTYDLDEHNMLKLYNAYIVYYVEYIGDLKNAIMYAQKGLELAEKLNDRNMAMRFKSNLGVINVRLGFYESAKELIEAALEYYISKDDVHHQMYDYNNLAEVYYYLGLIPQAKAYYQKSYKIACEKDEISIRIDSSVGLAKIYTDEKHYTDALDVVYNAIEYAKSCKNVKYEIETNIELAKVFVVQKKHIEAMEVLVKLEPSLSKTEIQTLNMVFYELKAKVASALNDYKSAFEAMELFHKFYVSSNDLKSERALNEAMQNEYKKTIQRLEVIAAVGRELTTLSNIDEVLFEVKKVLSNLMDIHGIGIGELKGEFIEYNHFLVKGTKMKPTKLRLDDTKSLAVWSVNNCKEVQINDLDKEYRLYVNEVARKVVIDENQPEDDSKVKSLLYAPLIVKNEIIGVFTIQSFNKNAFLTEELELFRIIVAYVAIAYKNVSQSMILEQLSLKDSLTNINNRRGFTEFYESIVELVDFNVDSASIIMLDLDFFKKINDTFGHVAGDEVLKCVAKLLMDKEDEFLITARLGGEEFGCIVFNHTKQEVLEFSENLRLSIENLEVKYGEEVIKVTTSVGISFEKYNVNTNFKRLYFEADQALFEAKNNGRNKVELYES